jgi:hypothetical protein
MTATATPTPAIAPRVRPSGVGAVAMTLALSAVLLLSIGGALVATHLTQRDGHGYFTSSRFALAAPGYAITSRQLDLAGGGHGNLARDAAQLSGTLRVSVASTDGKPIFVGIARQPDADRYLDRVARDEVTDAAGAHTTAVTHPGNTPVGMPTDQRVWQASAAGAGSQTMTWKIRPGRWTVAIMNADARKGVHADVRIGLKTKLFLWIGLALLAAGAIVGAAAGLRSARRMTVSR